MTQPAGRPAKIKRLKELEAVMRAARKAGKKVALCHGVFDVMHPGHIVHFKEAAQRADLVIVTVTPDRFVNKGPGRPVFDESLRLEALAAVEYIDCVALNEWPTAVETIALLKPDFYVKGAEYAEPGRDVTRKIEDEEKAIRAAGGKLVFTAGFSSSSSSIINRFFSAYPPETQEYLRDFRRRHDSAGIIRRLKRLSSLRALVVGEAIVDEYCYCIPMGKSPKETIVSTRFSSEERFAGGAAATTNHVAGFCREATLVTVLGADKGDLDFLSGKLRPNVRMLPLIQSDRPTIRKRRFVEPGFLTKMFEIQLLNDSALSADGEARLGAILEEQMPKYDLVIVNDFGHGMLTKKLRDLLSSGRKFMALNTQTNSANMGFNTVTNYRRADFAAIDEPELRLAAREKYGSITDMAARIRRSLGAKKFVVSWGPRGSIVLSSEGWTAAPALATRVVDRTGAGDALFALTSPCAYAGMAPDILAFVGNCIGAMAVETVCNREPVDPVRLYKFVESLLR